MPLFRYLLILLVVLAVLPAHAAEDSHNIDPWEPANRRVFAFNEGLDRYLLRPVAKGYRAVLPDAVERSVTNFIANIYEVNTIFNSLLQGRGEDAFQSTGRFVVNTTFGIAGLFDVASGIGIARRPADFGQTLYTWGVEQGPFVMAPIIGPRTVRSTTGYLVDTYTSIPALQSDVQAAYTFWTVEAVDTRAQLIKADQLLSGDRYIFLREAYLDRRAYFLSGGIVEDDFLDFSEGEDYEEF